MEWIDINSAPRDKEIELRTWYEPSTEAKRNGAKAHWSECTGHFIWEGLWSGVLGGKPSHWRKTTN